MFTAIGERLARSLKAPPRLNTTSRKSLRAIRKRRIGVAAQAPQAMNKPTMRSATGRPVCSTALRHFNATHRPQPLCVRCGNEANGSRAPRSLSETRRRRHRPSRRRRRSLAGRGPRLASSMPRSAQRRNRSLKAPTPEIAQIRHADRRARPHIAKEPKEAHHKRTDAQAQVAPPLRTTGSDPREDPETTHCTRT